MVIRIRRALRGRLSRRIDEIAERIAERVGREIRVDVESAVRRETARLEQLVRDVEFRARRDIDAAGERHAVATTEQFVRAHLPTVTTFPHPQETLHHALGLVPAGGMVLEFGVYSGSTLKMIASACAGHEVYGFDSFQGLPEDWRPNIPAGAFTADRPPEVDGAELVIGWFADTLGGFLDDHPGEVAFLHLDADLYSSTKTVLDHVGPRLRPGSVVVFDEYFNYPGWEQHEHRAWQEYVERSGTEFEYVCYTSNNEQLAVRITGC
ncbi:class I SAM-dependent methyltransferase [Amycolatopsis mongoliensis]|uniref:Class I SAM-dependent methyltransferase n=1 Tax=Amycolatopsis mongoliensis TaxID=715475 RepID=A0A9Y2JK46_9PSEU|nr:class I SAM-dependent methyltransferase [Amycolatopsis sp. 4-36]WIX98323.1 class I SAM-dependent methyltransferase [Amycolatopsis sp. 4-36]